MSEETCGESKPHLPSEPLFVAVDDAAHEAVATEPLSSPIAVHAMSDTFEDDGDGSDIEIVESLDLPAHALEIVPPPLESGTRSFESLEASLRAIAAADMLTTDDLDGFLSVLEEDRVPPLESGVAPRMPTIMPLARCGAPPELEPALTPLAPLPEDGFESAADVDASAPPPLNDGYNDLLCVLTAVAAEAGGADVLTSLEELLAADPVASAWRAILRGESDDFAACGAKSLDEWAADALARFLNAPSKAATFRRELRARGVAAFGLVPRAA